jgi:hypothetical protein
VNDDAADLSICDKCELLLASCNRFCQHVGRREGMTALMWFCCKTSDCTDIIKVCLAAPQGCDLEFQSQSGMAVLLYVGRSTFLVCTCPSSHFAADMPCFAAGWRLCESS